MTELSAEEGQIYDRQIRLWGSETQQRLSSAHIAIVGLTAVNVEAAKCLILAGIRVTLVEDLGVRHPLLHEHMKYNFFAPPDVQASELLDACGRILAALNPLTKVKTTKTLSSSEDFTELLIAAETCSWSDLLALNDETRRKNQGFFVSLCLGERAGFFSDFGPRHTTTSKAANQTALDLEDSAPQLKIVCFPSLREVAATDASKLPSGYLRRKALADLRLIVFRALLQTVHESKETQTQEVKKSLDAAGHSWSAAAEGWVAGQANPLVAAVVGGQLGGSLMSNGRTLV